MWRTLLMLTWNQTQNLLVASILIVQQLALPSFLHLNYYSWVQLAVFRGGHLKWMVQDWSRCLEHLPDFQLWSHYPHPILDHQLSSELCLQWLSASKHRQLVLLFSFLCLVIFLLIWLRLRRLFLSLMCFGVQVQMHMINPWYLKVHPIQIQVFIIFYNLLLSSSNQSLLQQVTLRLLKWNRKRLAFPLP